MIHIKTIYSGSAAVMARGAGATTQMMQTWLQNAYAKTLLHWHDTMRPKHFQESAKGEYGYRRRQKDYEEGKRESEGHTRPLAYGGESERATEQMEIRLTARGGSATLAMGAGNLAFTPKGGQVNMRRELTTVTAAENEELAGVFSRSMEMQIRGHSETFIKTLG